MNEFASFYTKSLYPFQDGILHIVKSIGAPFYLTGGTALSRYYRSPRYSDDLDLFVNDRPDFNSWVEQLFRGLAGAAKDGWCRILQDRTQRFSSAVQIFVESTEKGGSPGTLLKVDLVNDVAPRFGDLEWDDALGRIDSWRNILSNKITALYRVEVKDVVDLWFLSKSRAFNWTEIIKEACEKEAGIDPLVLVDLLKSFPVDELSSIKWIDPVPDFRPFEKEISLMADDIFMGSRNRLAGRQ
jgi:hypothetical protein